MEDGVLFAWCAKSLPGVKVQQLLLLQTMVTYVETPQVLLFVNMGENAQNARSVEVLLFVNIREYAQNARSVEALLFVNTGDGVVIAGNVYSPRYCNPLTSPLPPYPGTLTPFNQVLQRATGV